VVLLLAPLYGQKTTGSIRGSITDQSGAVVANASVNITNLSTGATRTVSSTSAGDFAVPDLEPGTYKIAVKAASFKEAVVNSVEVHVSTLAIVNVKLEVGGATEVMEVAANALQVQTDSASLGEVIDSTQVKELPLNGRSFVELTQLAPGVSAANNFDTKNKGLQGGVDFSVNGNATTNNLYLVDGANNNDVGSNRTILLYPSIESIAEFKMLRNSAGPEYGQASGAVISILTKSGTNQFHGSVFYDGRNDALNAYNYFDKYGIPEDQRKKGKQRRNDYGFSIGGPAWKDHVFFFVSEEWNKEHRGTATTSCVPTAAELSGDFSQDFPGGGNDQCGASQPHFPVALTVPGNPFKLANLSPGGALLAARLPTPNIVGGGNTNWRLDGTRNSNWRQDNARVDINLTKNHTLMGRFTEDKWGIPSPTAGAGFWGDDVFPTLNSDWKQPSKMIVGKLTSTLGTSMVNDAEFAYSNNRINISAGGSDPGLLAQISGAVAPLYPEAGKHSHLGIPVMWGGFQNYGNNQNYWMQAPWTNQLDIYTFRDDFSKVAGSHTIKAGFFFGWDGKQEDINNPGSERPNFGTPDWGIAGSSPVPGTGNPLANVLAPGVVWNLNEASTNPRIQLKWRDYEFYVGDTWKVRRNVTLEYGIRYSFLRTPYDALNRGTSFQPFLYDPTKPGSDACNGLWAVPGTDPCGDANSQFGTTYSTAATGPNKYLVNQNNHLIAPRLGIAWDPWSDGKTAVRLGVGQFFQRERVSQYFVFVNNAPFALASPTVERTLDGPTPASLSGNASPSGGRDPSSDVPNSWQWNLSVEHSFNTDTALQLGYVGNRAIHQTSSYDVNQPAASDFPQTAFLTGGAFNALRPYSNFGELGYWVHSGNAIYHSLQTLFKTRYKRSQLTAAYTWSHSIGDVVLDGSNGNPSSADEYTSYQTDPRLDRGNSKINRPHIFVANFTYFFPELKGKSVLERAVLGGWELSGIQSASSGNSFSIFNDSNGDIGNNHPFDPSTCTVAGDLTSGNCSRFGSTIQSVVGTGRAGTIRPLKTNVPCSGTGGNQIYNPEAFTMIGWQIGTLPSNMAPRGYCGGPSYINTDFSVNKNWKLGERVNMQFRLDLFDAFNHPNFRADQIFTSQPFNGYNCGGTSTQVIPSGPQAGTYTVYQACSPTNNIITNQTRNDNFGKASGLVGGANREIQYQLKFTF
jgi:Carboxypeptidase regulatory-like domain/TonB-dependent Receptor Plug Domain